MFILADFGETKKQNKLKKRSVDYRRGLSIDDPLRLASIDYFNPVRNNIAPKEVLDVVSKKEMEKSKIGSTVKSGRGYVNNERVFENNQRNKLGRMTPKERLLDRYNEDSSIREKHKRSKPGYSAFDDWADKRAAISEKQAEQKFKAKVGNINVNTPPISVTSNIPDTDVKKAIIDMVEKAPVKTGTKGKGGLALGLGLGAGALGIAGIGTALALANRRKKEKEQKNG